jgi:nucleoside 2-deoxyribosyltransferase
MAKVYLAAPFAEYLKVEGYAHDLEARGHVVTSRWHRDHVALWHKDPSKKQGQEYARSALDDLEDIDQADTIICLTQGDDTTYTSGGRHFEAGYAYATGKHCIVFGPVENVFYNLFAWATSWEQVVSYL